MKREQAKVFKPSGSSSSERRKRVVPLSFQLAGMVLNGVSLIRNEWAAGVLSRLWFTVFKTERKPWVAEFWQQADYSFDIEIDNQPVPVYSWGQGKLVVCMHGWSGSGTQFRQFIAPLVADGFQVVCFDAPAHGSHPGKQAHMLQFSACLFAIQQKLGRIDTLIAHSLGAMAAAHSTNEGLEVDRAVLVAPHLNVEEMFETYRQLLNMRPQLASRFHQKIGDAMRDLLDGRDPWGIMLPARLLGKQKLPGMLIYDHEDDEIAEWQFDEIIEHWQGCASFTTRGQGHNRILKDPSVVDAVREYLSP